MTEMASITKRTAFLRSGLAARMARSCIVESSPLLVVHLPSWSTITRRRSWRSNAKEVQKSLLILWQKNVIVCKSCRKRNEKVLENQCEPFWAFLGLEFLEENLEFDFFCLGSFICFLDSRRSSKVSTLFINFLFFPLRLFLIQFWPPNLDDHPTADVDHTRVICRI